MLPHHNFIMIMSWKLPTNTRRYKFWLATAVPKSSRDQASKAGGTGAHADRRRPKGPSAAPPRGARVPTLAATSSRAHQHTGREDQSRNRSSAVPKRYRCALNFYMVCDVRGVRTKSPADQRGDARFSSTSMPCFHCIDSEKYISFAGKQTISKSSRVWTVIAGN